jgi:hypothetical protein
VAVFSHDGEVYPHPLLFWAVVATEDGGRRVDAFTEPSIADGGCGFVGTCLETSNFVCFVRAEAFEQARDTIREEARR